MDFSVLLVIQTFPQLRMSRGSLFHLKDATSSSGLGSSSLGPNRHALSKELHFCASFPVCGVILIFRPAIFAFLIPLVTCLSVPEEETLLMPQEHRRRPASKAVLTLVGCLAGFFCCLILAPTTYFLLSCSPPFTTSPFSMGLLKKDCKGGSVPLARGDSFLVPRNV